MKFNRNTSSLSKIADVKVKTDFDSDWKLVTHSEARLREENSRLKGGSDGDRRRIDLLEKKVVNAENANIALTRKNAALEEVKIQLERELDDKELVINANKKQQDRYVNVNNSYKRSKVVGGHFRGVEINCRGGKYFKS